MTSKQDIDSPVFSVRTADDAAHITAAYRPLLLRVRGIGKRFGNLVALEDINLDVPRHSIFSIIGPNGSGKTVFFNILTGLEKPDAGEVWFNGKQIAGRSPHRIAALGVGRTFQNIRLFDNMTVLENVLVGEHNHLRGSIFNVVMGRRSVFVEEAEARRRSMDLLDFFGLSRVAGAVANSLPYGDQRRLEIARALALRPQMLLLDEPTAGMTPRETEETARLLKALRREWGITVLVIEHDMKVVMRMSDRVAVLESGLLIAEGSPDEVRSNPRVVEAYLGRASVEHRGAAGLR